MKILMVHGDLRAGGGAESYAQALARRIEAAGHELDQLDIHGLRAASGTQGHALLALGRLPGLRTLHLLKYALVCRVLRRHAHRYDRIVLSYGEAPAQPVPTLTVRHAPALFATDTRALDALGAAGRGPVHRITRRLYTHAMRRITGLGATPAAGTIVANSHWTARQIAARAPGAAIAVLYPGVQPIRPQERPRDRFAIIAIGRLTRNKRIEDAIAAIAALRARGFPASLDIVGRAGTPYARNLMRRHGLPDWIRFHPDAGADDLRALLGHATFGLHTYRQEHFGIAVAEMILAGVVPVVFDGGGVRELVTEPALRFTSVAEAADRLSDLMMRHPDEVTDLALALADGAALRNALGFEDRAARILGDFLDPAA